MSGLDHALWFFLVLRAAGCLLAGGALPWLAWRDRRPVVPWLLIGPVLGLVSGPLGAFLVHAVWTRLRDRGRPVRAWTWLTAVLPLVGYLACRTRDDGRARGLEGPWRPALAAAGGLLLTTALAAGCILAFTGHWGRAWQAWTAGILPVLAALALDWRLRPPVRRPTLMFADVVDRTAAAGRRESMDGALLRGRDLVKRFPARTQGNGRAWLAAVDGVSFHLAPGESLGLVGESGSGKTTLARMILGLLRPDRGTVLYDGIHTSTLSRGEWRALRREMQVVFQDPSSALNPRMTAGSLVAEPLVIHQMAAGRPREAWVNDLLRRVGLEPAAAHRYPHEFSGGQRQRIGIARALASNPRLLVCDEPVSALDVSVRAQVVNLLADLQREMGLALLLIAHDLTVVQYLCDRTAVLYLGRIAEVGPTGRVLGEPLHPYSRALLASVPRVEEGATRPALAGEIPSPLSPPSGCRFHPRCPLAEERCRIEEPSLREHGPGHRAACHLAGGATFPGVAP